MPLVHPMSGIAFIHFGVPNKKAPRLLAGLLRYALT
jgi:hypothetical protein